MVDDRHFVDEERNLAGLRILAMTDAVGFDAFAAGWIHDRPTKTWRYLLSTPMLKTKGPLWVYERLMAVFKHTPLPAGVSPLDIFVIEPDYEISLFGNHMMGKYMYAEKVPLDRIEILTIAQDIEFGEFSVTDGFVLFYRRLPIPDRQRKRDPARTFDHRVRKLEAA